MNATRGFFRTSNDQASKAAADRIITSAERAANVDTSALMRALESGNPASVVSEARDLARRLAELSIDLSADAHDLIRAQSA